MLVIGIGCNIGAAPSVSATGKEGGRPATCLAEHNIEIAETLATLRSISVGLEADIDSEVGESVLIDQPVVYGEKNILVSENSLSLGKLKVGDYHKEIAIEISNKIADWIESGNDSKELVLADFGSNMDYSPQRLRTTDPTGEISFEKSEVIPLGLNHDGTLKVCFFYYL